MLSFVLGLFVAGAFVYCVYYFNKGENHRKHIQFSRKSRQTSNSEMSEYGDDFSSDSAKFSVRKFPKNPPQDSGIETRKSSSNDVAPRPDPDDYKAKTYEDLEPRSSYVAPKNTQQKADYVMSAVKSEVVFIQDYYLRLHDRGGSYYLRVNLKSFQKDKWLSADLDSIKAKTKAIASLGGKSNCLYLWPMEDGNDNSIIIKMIFVVPSTTSIKGIEIDGQKYSVKVTSKK